MIPARMSFEDCAASCAAATRRRLRAEKASVAAPRPQAREISNVWKGTEFSRLTYDWNATRTHIDEELKGNLVRLRARGRELARNNSYVRQYLNLLRWNVVGPRGMDYQAQVRNNDGSLSKGFNDRLEACWSEWWSAPTVDKKQTGVEFAGLALETVANEGEAFIRFHRGRPGDRYGIALELIDPDRVDEQYFRYPGDGVEIRMGVEIDEYGRPLAYHVWDHPVGLVSMVPAQRRERVPASDILHLFKLVRTNQTRGVTWHAANMFTLNMIDHYEEAELTAARLHASTSMVLTRKQDTVGAPLGDENGKVEFDANPGSVLIAPEGYDFNTWDPQHPSPNVAPFLKAMLRKAASGWGISYNQLANDLEGVNFSSMRSGLLSERDTWRGHQEWLIEALMRPTHRQWLAMAAITGEVVLDARPFARFLEANWIPRGWGYVNPKDEVDADLVEISAGLTSRKRVAAERGQDIEQIFEELRQEQELAAQYGIDISGQSKPKPAESPAASETPSSSDEPTATRARRRRKPAITPLPLHEVAR